MEEFVVVEESALLRAQPLLIRVLEERQSAPVSLVLEKEGLASPAVVWSAFACVRLDVQHRHAGLFPVRALVSGTPALVSAATTGAVEGPLPFRPSRRRPAKEAAVRRSALKTSELTSSFDGEHRGLSDPEVN